MKIYLYVDENNYVSGWGSTRSSDNNIEIELDDNHEFFNSDFSCWKYIDGELVFDEEKRRRLLEEYEREQNEPTETERLEALENAVLELILKGDDDD